jgi:hypothetical protein
VSLLSSVFRFSVRFVWDSLPIFVFHLWFSGLRTTLANSATQAQAVQMSYNSSQQELEELRTAALEVCQEVEEGEVQAESSMASRLHAIGRHITQRMHRTLTWVSRRPSGWWLPTTGLTPRPSLRAMSSLSASTTRWR